VGLFDFLQIPSPPSFLPPALLLLPPHLLYPTAKFHWWGSLEIAVLVSRFLFALIVGWGPSELLQIILVCHHKSLSKFICLTACAQYSSFAAWAHTSGLTSSQTSMHAHTHKHTLFRAQTLMQEAPNGLSTVSAHLL
jgi:hypothetical protein